MLHRLFLIDHLRKLWAYRALIRLWLQYNLVSRYSQTVLGIGWIILIPVATSAILSLVFSEFLRMDFTEDVPFISFFLAALVPWMLFNQGVSQGMNAVTSKLMLISQIYFPREILVLITLGEGLVDFFIMFLCMIVINALVGVYPGIYLLFVPVLLGIQLTFTLGIMFFLSSASVIIRDIPQLTGVVLQLMFYITPIIYPTHLIPEQYRILIYLNPLSPLITAYRDVIVYQQMPNLGSLFVPFVLAVFTFYVGYTFFKRQEITLPDFI